VAYVFPSFQGHYAGLQYYYPGALQSSPHGRLLRARDPIKDQSYFLSAVPSEQLGRTFFPISHLLKTEVRQLAKELRIPTAQSEESMGLCFVGERRKGAVTADRIQSSPSVNAIGGGGFAGFLGDYIESRPGDVVTLEGTCIGRHSGLHTVTIGQGARIGGAKEKQYVAAKNAKLNQVIVVPGKTHPWLQCHTLRVSSFTFIAEGEAGDVLDCDHILAQVRHRQSAVPCKAARIGNQVEVQFSPTILSIAEGQICALYKGQECLGSGVITSVETEGSRHVQKL
jgi:tRNA U34 2-thiouridine synthase MnmA/TrmU